MNQLPRSKRSQMLMMLCEGVSMQAISRITGVSITTVGKLLRDAGETCAEFHDRAVRGLHCERIECDEIWSFVYAKDKNVAAAKRPELALGSTWTWTVKDPETKLVMAFQVGSREAPFARALLRDARSRIDNERVQITTDGHRPYPNAVEDAFGADADYAILVKKTRNRPRSQSGDKKPEDGGPEVPTASEAEAQVQLFLPPLEAQAQDQPALPLDIPAKNASAPEPFIKKFIIAGNPNPAHISTSITERHNLTMRQSMRRFTRRTTGFSKRLRYHAYMVALYTVWFNFARIHKTLRVSPAMAAGIETRLWSMEDIVSLMDARAGPPQKRGPYKPRRPRRAAPISN